MDRNIKEQWERLKEAVQTRDGTKALDELYEFVEDTFIDPIYCPSCGSCGDTGCHPNPNVCHYVDTHQEHFDSVLKQKELFATAVDEIQDLADNWHKEFVGAQDTTKLGFAMGRILARTALAIGDALLVDK